MSPDVNEATQWPVSADDALAMLKKGNRRFLRAKRGLGDCSSERRASLTDGQKPYAVVVSCSDSRVVPEDIFSAGLGEIFVIRVAGNVFGDHEAGSVEYATGHLGAKLVVVMGHECCGAIAAALEGHADGCVQSLIKAIKPGIGRETDPRRASAANAAYVAKKLSKKINAGGDDTIKVISAFYNLNGKVEFFDE